MPKLREKLKVAVQKPVDSMKKEVIGVLTAPVKEKREYSKRSTILKAYQADQMPIDHKKTTGRNQTRARL